MQQANLDQENRSPGQRLLVAGTGYGVGKSVVLEAIAQHQSTLPGGVAPEGVSWGRYALHQAAAGQMDLAESWRSLQATTQHHPNLLIEAVGSLGTIVTPQTTLADLAWDWRLPTLLVTAVSPHCLDDLVAYAALAKQSRCAVQGIVLNCMTPAAEEHLLDWANPRQVATLTQLPIWGKIPYLPDLGELLALGEGDRQRLALAGAGLDMAFD